MVNIKRLRRIWNNIHSRCYNPKFPSYKHYGGRGIKCLWKSFSDFKKDMYQSYLKASQEFGEVKISIDRKNNNSHYSLSNCHWTTKFYQSRNTRQNHRITYQTRDYVMKDLAIKLGINYQTLASRLNRQKMEINKALVNSFVPRKDHKYISFKKQTLTLFQWSRKLNISPQLLSWRLKNWSLERIFV